MEKYFMVTEQSPLHGEWFDYKENQKAVRALMKQFTADNGIEADGYYAAHDAFYIEPTEKDAETFKSVLGAPLENGLRKFRSVSKIGKAWVKALKDSGLKILRKPMVLLYFNGFGGKFRSRLFDQNGILYCSMDPVQGETPIGFVEMKASEFFKVIEDSENVPA